MKSRHYFFTFLLLSIFGSCTLIKHPPTKSYVKAVKEPYDAVIIPGFPHDGKSWNMVIKFRMLWAVHLYENNLAKNFIFSGGAVHTEYIEAKIMGMYAIKMGIPRENVFIETKAEHSTENVFYSLEIADKMGFKNVAIATDPVQGLLLRHYTERIRHRKINYVNLRPHLIRAKKHCNEPQIDFCNAYVENHIPQKNDKTYLERKKGSLGLNINYGMETNKYLKYSKWFNW